MRRNDPAGGTVSAVGYGVGLALIVAGIVLSLSTRSGLAVAPIIDVSGLFNLVYVEVLVVVGGMLGSYLGRDHATAVRGVWPVAVLVLGCLSAHAASAGLPGAINPAAISIPSCRSPVER